MSNAPNYLDNAPVNALDPRGLSQIQRQAKTNDPKALRAAAQQFEALFLQMVLKSMRDATPREGLFDSDQSRMYEGLLDQQLSQVLASKRGVGLAAVIERQFGRNSGTEAVEFLDGLPLEVQRQMRLSGQGVASAIPSGADARSLDGQALQTSAGLSASATGARVLSGLGPAWPRPGAGREAVLRETPGAVPPPPTFAGDAAGVAPGVVQRFIDQVRPLAEQAEQQTGIPAPFMIAQAALETGWGRYEPKRSDGSPSYNLFGIKAGTRWGGESVTASTTEVIQGVPQQRREQFRAYSSYAESFADYAQMLANNPRYAGLRSVQGAGDFAWGLQQAGYATDPAYAAKLSRVIGMVVRQESAAA